MTESEIIRGRLLELASERLRNMPSAYHRLQLALDGRLGLSESIYIQTMATIAPIGAVHALHFGKYEYLDKYLITIIDEWAQKHNQSKISVQPLETTRVTSLNIGIAAPTPSTTQTNNYAKRRAELDLSTFRGAPRRVLENWDKIVMQYGEAPDARQVSRVLRQDKSEKMPALKTVQNTLSKLKQKQLIP